MARFYTTATIFPLVWFAGFDPRRLRQCESCILHFHDTTNSARVQRKLCGNRGKVAK
jgi:predicted RNA-binding Zn ribbon-like protein